MLVARMEAVISRSQLKVAEDYGCRVFGRSQPVVSTWSLKDGRSASKNNSIILSGRALKVMTCNKNDCLQYIQDLLIIIALETRPWIIRMQ